MVNFEITSQAKYAIEHCYTGHKFKMASDGNCYFFNLIFVFALAKSKSEVKSCPRTQHKGLHGKHIYK
jgi:hypothetical protein